MLIDIYWFNELQWRLDVDIKARKLRVLENRVSIIFSPKISCFDDLVRFLEGRRIDFGRLNRSLMMGLPNGYTPSLWDEIGITQAYSSDDFLWVYSEGLGCRFKDIRDFHHRVEGYRGGSVYARAV